MERSKLGDLVDKLVHRAAEFSALGGGNPFQPQSFGLYTKLGKGLFKQQHPPPRLIVTAAVVAITGVATGYHYAIGSLGKGM